MEQQSDGLKVMVIDDSKTIRRTAETLLKKVGWRALRRIHTDYASALDIDTLAREANMSVSTFHHNFKAMTFTSPLQYLKSVRLYKAWSLMVQDGLNASTAASQVGYESPSQFSREFKRYFGRTPSEEVQAARG
ncbi:hypothetical protein G039_0333215 [Pseudomonas aeruginosa VRFPA01]|nr:hypothetical protein G039_0333215 [Pseudomonas aeruginosa VRFPA01]